MSERLSSGCREDTKFSGVGVEGLSNKMKASKLTKVCGLREAGLLSLPRVTNLERKLVSAYYGL